MLAAGRLALLEGEGLGLQTQFPSPNAILPLGSDVTGGNQRVMLAKLPLHGRKPY